MAESVTKLPVKTEEKKHGSKLPSHQAWGPFGSLHREVNKLFEDFERGMWHPFFPSAVFESEPFWRSEPLWKTELTFSAPAVDIVEKDKAFEVTAELPGMDEKNIEVKLENGYLRIKAEKHEEKEEKKKDYCLSERQYGSFERTFSVPENVEAEKIEATYKKGVLTLTLPKKVEAQNPVKKIEVKAA